MSQWSRAAAGAVSRHSHKEVGVGTLCSWSGEWHGNTRENNRSAFMEMQHATLTDMKNKN